MATDIFYLLDVTHKKFALFLSAIPQTLSVFEYGTFLLSTAPSQDVWTTDVSWWLASSTETWRRLV